MTIIHNCFKLHLFLLVQISPKYKFFSSINYNFMRIRFRPVIIKKTLISINGDKLVRSWTFRYHVHIGKMVLRRTKLIYMKIYTPISWLFCQSHNAKLASKAKQIYIKTRTPMSSWMMQNWSWGSNRFMLDMKQQSPAIFVTGSVCLVMWPQWIFNFLMQKQ